MMYLETSVYIKDLLFNVRVRKNFYFIIIILNKFDFHYTYSVVYYSYYYICLFKVFKSIKAQNKSSLSNFMQKRKSVKEIHKVFKEKSFIRSIRPAVGKLYHLTNH